MRTERSSYLTSTISLSKAQKIQQPKLSETAKKKKKVSLFTLMRFDCVRVHTVWMHFIAKNGRVAMCKILFGCNIERHAHFWLILPLLVNHLWTHPEKFNYPKCHYRHFIFGFHFRLNEYFGFCVFVKNEFRCITNLLSGGKRLSIVHLRQLGKLLKAAKKLKSFWWFWLRFCKPTQALNEKCCHAPNVERHAVGTVILCGDPGLWRRVFLVSLAVSLQTNSKVYRMRAQVSTFIRENISI